ncbi:hypothetical protein ACRAWF_16350 [Streptomyces sp. L7]
MRAGAERAAVVVLHRSRRGGDRTRRGRRRRAGLPGQGPRRTGPVRTRGALRDPAQAGRAGGRRPPVQPHAGPGERPPGTRTAARAPAARRGRGSRGPLPSRARAGAAGR